MAQEEEPRTAGREERRHGRKHYIAFALATIGPPCECCAPSTPAASPMHRGTLPALFLGAMLAVSPASAQDTSQPRKLSLDQALALAQESNAGLRAVRQRVEEADRRNRVVFSNY